MEDHALYITKKKIFGYSILVAIVLICSYFSISYVSTKSKEIKLETYSLVPNLSISFTPSSNSSPLLEENLLRKIPKFSKIKKITLVLTNIPQPDNLIFADKERKTIFSSTSQKYDGQNLYILVYLNPDLTIKKLDNNTLSSYVNSLFLYRIYQLQASNQLTYNTFYTQEIKNKPNTQLVKVLKK